MSKYRTNDGDMVDAICKAHYGNEDKAVEVYAANPGLAQRGPVLPMGLIIELPEISMQNVQKSIRLWN